MSALHLCIVQDRQKTQSYNWEPTTHCKTFSRSNSTIYNNLIFFAIHFQVLGIICMSLASPAYIVSTHWFLFVVVTAFIATILWICVYFLGVREVLNLSINWILTVIYFLNSNMHFSIFRIIRTFRNVGYFIICALCNVGLAQVAWRPNCNWFTIIRIAYLLYALIEKFYFALVACATSHGRNKIYRSISSWWIYNSFHFYRPNAVNWNVCINRACSASSGCAKLQFCWGIRKQELFIFISIDISVLVAISSGFANLYPVYWPLNWLGTPSTSLRWKVIHNWCLRAMKTV